MLFCILGSGGEGLGLLGRYNGLSEVWVASNGMAFGLFMCMSEKGVNFIHIELK